MEPEAPGFHEAYGLLLPCAVKERCLGAAKMPSLEGCVWKWVVPLFTQWLYADHYPYEMAISLGIYSIFRQTQKSRKEPGIDVDASSDQRRPKSTNSLSHRPSAHQSQVPGENLCFGNSSLAWVENALFGCACLDSCAHARRSQPTCMEIW